MKVNVDYLNRPLPYPRNRLPEEQRHKVLVVGPKDLRLPHYKWLCKMLDRAVFGFDDPYILARGASLCLSDKFIINWASYNWYTMWLFHTNEGQHKPTEAARIRDAEMIEKATHMIALYDGYDPWVERMILEAREAKVKVRVYE